MKVAAVYNVNLFRRGIIFFYNFVFAKIRDRYNFFCFIGDEFVLIFVISKNQFITETGKIFGMNRAINVM